MTLIVVGALNRFGTEEQKRDLFGRVVRGGTLAIAMSEPEAGSDVAALKTRARRDNGSWVLDGAKMWCSYAHKASHILIVCRTGAGERHEDMSMILVPRETDGDDDHADPDARRRGDQRDPPRRRARARRTRCSARRAAAGPS